MTPLLAILGVLAGVPGPDSVVVVARHQSAESVALARLYARARQLPDRHLCLVDAPDAEDLPLAELDTGLGAELARCLAQDQLGARIEALVLARGLPLNVLIPRATGPVRVSLAAALALGDSTTSTGARVLGRDPGVGVPCGGGATCYGARWSNPYRSGVFRPGFAVNDGSTQWRPRIVTMLHGRSARDAARLVASATTAEALGGARGTFLLMAGADPARGVLDPSYPGVLRSLTALGFTDAEQVSFDADLQGRTLAALFVGTAGLGRTIEGNTYAPGAIVDNLTSFGAVAENFRETGEAQVSIARWVSMGVAGVHGTTDEPLNNCFPARTALVAYAEGGTLGEAYFRALPFAYWRNLVLGDPMAAPYAVRPRVTIDGLVDGEAVAGSRRVRVEVEDPLGRRVDVLKLYVDGLEVASSAGAAIEACVSPPSAADVQVLAVAQIADRRTTDTRHRPKGWSAVRVRVEAGPANCPAPPDAGPTEDAPAADAAADAQEPLDAGANDGASFADVVAVADAAAPTPTSSGCACASTPRASPVAVLAMAVALSAATRRSRRRAG